MHYKNLQILIIVIVIVIVIGYFWQKQTQESDLQFSSLDDVSGELDSALQPSQSLQNLLE